MAAFKSVLEINTLGTVIPSRIFGLQMASQSTAAFSRRQACEQLEYKKGTRKEDPSTATSESNTD